MVNTRFFVREVGQRLSLPIVIFLIMLSGIWLGGDSRELEFGKAAIGTLIVIAVLWVLEPVLQMFIQEHDEEEEVERDGDVA